MSKEIICIECPVGCSLSVDRENCRVVRVQGNKCPKGEVYAVSEIENPTRILTSSVLSHGLALKMVPVRTDKPIPKGRLTEAMQAVKRVRLKKNVRAGEIIVRNFLNLGVNLISTLNTYLFNPRG
jgi:CxxC motif-containing protein